MDSMDRGPLHATIAWLFLADMAVGIVLAFYGIGVANALGFVAFAVGIFLFFLGFVALVVSLLRGPFQYGSETPWMEG